MIARYGTCKMSLARIKVPHAIFCLHMKQKADGLLDGDGLLLCLAALANPQRLRILAALSGGRAYVSQLARNVGLSRPLLQMHLRKLDAAGLVSCRMELSPDGKAMNFYELTPFRLVLDPERVTVAAATLEGGAIPDASEANLK